MILTALMLFVEALKAVFFNEKSEAPSNFNIKESSCLSRMPSCLKNFFGGILCLIISPIWPIITLTMTSWKQFRQSISSDPKKESEDIEKLTTLSNRSHLIEVCFESSLQPLVQLHVILNELLKASSILNSSNAFDWTKALEAFWNKDLMQILDLKQSFNPQVNKSPIHM